MRKLLWEQRWILLALFGLVILNYYPVLGHGDLIDDALFREGRWAAGYGGYRDFLTRSDSQHYSPFYFIVNYWLFENFAAHPQVLAALNIVLFYLSLVGFFILTCLWTGSVTIASLTALLMALHPVLGFAVGYKTANFVFYGALWQQLALYFLWRSTRHPTGQRRNTFLSLLSGLAALLSSEWAVLLPLYAVVMLRWLCGWDWRAGLRRSAGLIVLTAGFVILYCVMAGSRVGFAERFLRLGFSPLEYGSVLIGFLGDYLLTVFLPFRPTVFMAAVRAMTGTEWILFATGMAAIGGVWVLLSKRLLSRAAGFGWVWFLLGWLPVGVAMLGHPSAGLVFEQQWVYFASYGLFLATACGLVRVGSRLPKAVGVGLVAGVALCLLFASRPLQRVMTTEQAFCEYWLTLSPDNPIALSRLGQIEFRNGNHARALSLLDKLASSLDGEHYRELNNIGLIYYDLGRLAKAERLLRQVLEIRPNFAPAWNNLGQVVREAGRPQEALDFFLKAHSLDPRLPAARLNLAEMVLTAGQPHQASRLVKPLDEAAVNPFYREQALIIAHIAALAQQDTDEAERIDLQLKKLFPGPAVQLRLAHKMLTLGQGRRAQALLEELLTTHPDQSEAYVLLGSYLGNREEWQAAIQIWDDARRRFPDDPRFDRLITEARRLQAAGP